LTLERERHWRAAPLQASQRTNPRLNNNNNNNTTTTTLCHALHWTPTTVATGQRSSPIGRLNQYCSAALLAVGARLAFCCCEEKQANYFGGVFLYSGNCDFIFSNAHTHGGQRPESVFSCGCCAPCPSTSEEAPRADRVFVIAYLLASCRVTRRPAL